MIRGYDKYPFYFSLEINKNRQKITLNEMIENES